MKAFWLIWAAILLTIIGKDCRGSHAALACVMEAAGCLLFLWAVLRLYGKFMRDHKKDERSRRK